MNSKLRKELRAAKDGMSTGTRAGVDAISRELEIRLLSLRELAANIKSDDTVDDAACDEIAFSARETARRYNEVAKLLGFRKIIVPDLLEPSPYQEKS